MLLCAEYVLPITSDPIERGAVLVRDGKIRDLGAQDIMRLRYPDEETHDFGQAALLPGFVDVHTQLEHSVMRGIVHDVPYATWLLAVQEKAALMSSSDLCDSAILGGLEALSSGVTTVADITASGASLNAVARLGLRGVIYREVTAMDRRRVDYAMKTAKADIRRWREEVDDDRITVGIAPGALYACHPSIYQQVSEFAGDDMPVAMSLAGSMEEYNFIEHGSSPLSVHSMGEERGFVEIPPWLPTGATPINYALNWGAFNAGNVMAIHCVHVDEADIEKLRENDVSIAICTRSNAQLGMGVAPLNDYMLSGMRVGLGTDSPAAADSTDMFIEMRTTMLLQRAINVGRFLSADSMLEMATIGGARALKIDDKVGSLEIGKLADITAIDISGSHQTPTNDPTAAVVNTSAGSDVVMTMVGGDILYEKNQWHVDVEVARNIAHVIEIRGKLRS